MLARIRIYALAVLGSVALTQTGCISLSSFMGQRHKSTLDTTLLEAQGYAIPRGGMPTAVDPELAGKGPHVVLEIRGGARHLESIPLPMDRAVFIEDLVQQARLHDQLGRLSISVMRNNGTGQPPLKMDLRTDDDGKATNIGQNYALLPGDHIIVFEDSRNALERFVDAQFKS